jgi:hypothetical protein
MSANKKSRGSAGGARKFGAEDSDDEDEVVRIHKPKRLANVDAIRNTLKEMIVTEKNPFFVDEVVLLELFRKTCFSLTPLQLYTDKMRLLMMALWEEKPGFVKQIASAKRNEFFDKKLANMVTLDVVLRMFAGTLLVKYPAYSPSETFLTFCNSLITMGAINWSTLHALMTVEYPIQNAEAAVLNTYMNRWCDSYAVRRTNQFKMLLGMLHRPSHFDTCGALDNLDQPFTHNYRNAAFPLKTSDFRNQRTFLGLLVEQTGTTLERREVMAGTVQLPDNPLLEAINDCRQTYMKVAVKLKQELEYDGEDTRHMDYEFVPDNGFMNIEVNSCHYLAAYNSPNTFNTAVNIPMPVRQQTGTLVPFPLLDNMRTNARKILTTAFR